MKPTTVLDRVRKSALLLFVFLAVSANAQLLPEDPDWKEEDAPAPPAFNKDRLVAVDMPAFMSLSFGIDPTTLAVGKDGIVRYVMVASHSSGAVNAMYEGIRCSTGQVKTYARYLSTGWRVLPDPTWKALTEDATTRTALALAKQGVCEGRSPTGPVQAIIRKLNDGGRRLP